MSNQAAPAWREDALILAVARRIYHAEHPRSQWLIAPNYAQRTVQERYLETARVIVNQVRAHDQPLDLVILR